MKASTFQEKEKETQNQCEIDKLSLPTHHISPKYKETEASATNHDPRWKKSYFEIKRIRQRENININFSSEKSFSI